MSPSRGWQLIGLIAGVLLAGCTQALELKSKGRVVVVETHGVPYHVVKDGRGELQGVWLKLPMSEILEASGLPAIAGTDEHLEVDLSAIDVDDYDATASLKKDAGPPPRFKDHGVKGDFRVVSALVPEGTADLGFRLQPIDPKFSDILFSCASNYVDYDAGLKTYGGCSINASSNRFLQVGYFIPYAYLPEYKRYVSGVRRVLSRYVRGPELGNATNGK